MRGNAALIGSTALYLCVVATLLAISSGLPYVTDGNESFSIYLHANNALRFGLAQSAGLADEATSPAPEAHPYVYTHGGNFPRLPAQLLLRLGVSDIRWHIAIAAVVIGSLSTILCFKFFSSVSNKTLASIVCLVLATDYLLYIQWQVNSFRVWHGLLFFGQLYLVNRALRTSRRRYFLLLFLNAACVAYFELVFALFTVTTSIVYTVVTLWNHLTRVPALVAPTVLGGVFAATILIAQVFAYLGPERAIEDIKLTYFARNFASTLSEEDREVGLLRFFSENHIVFWDSRYEGNYLAPQQLLANLARTALRVDTPFLLLATTIVGVALALLALRQISDGRALALDDNSGSPRGASWWRWHNHSFLALVAAIAMPYLFLSWSIQARVPLRLGDEIASVPLVGIPRDVFVTAALATVSLSAAGAAILDRLRSSHRTGRFARAVAIASGLWVLFVYVGPQFYDASLSALWFGAARLTWPPLVLQALLCCVVISAAAICLGLVTPHLARPEILCALRAGATVVVAGALGFALTYLLVPGQVVAAYLMRRAPMPVFFIDPFIALTLYALGAVAWGAWSRRERLLGSIAGSATVLLCAYWISLQITHVRLMPPTGIEFMQRLASAPYGGASFVSNGYGAPISYFTRSWTLTDLVAGKDEQRRVGDEYQLLISGKYAWFADLDRNPAYWQPRYYLCWMTLDLKTATEDVAEGRELRNCSAEPIYRDTAFHRVVERDVSGKDLWAIIELDPRVKLVPTWNSGRQQP